MCTYPPGVKDHTQFDGLQNLELKTQKNKLKVDEIFFSPRSMYKADCYHCYKPDSLNDSTKWRKYGVEGFRKAFNQKMLENVETYKYDKYWNNNNVDPKVLKTLTSSERKMRRVLRKSYGFRYTKMIPGYYARSNNVSSLNLTACIKKCIQKKNLNLPNIVVKVEGFSSVVLAIIR